MIDPISFSVVIPTRDRVPMLEQCLSSLCNLEYPPENWELIIVDDGSEQPVSSAIQRFSSELPLQVLRITPSAGPAHARNAGAKVARGHHIVFLDDDCRVMPDWLSAYDAGFSETNHHALGGTSIYSSSEMAGSRVWHFLLDFMYEYRKDSRGNALIIVSNNCAYEREAFLSIGGFDPQFPLAASEDRDISWRMLENGYTQAYYPAARVHHDQPQLSMFQYIRLQFRYGRGAHYFRRKLRTAVSPTDTSLRTADSRIRYAGHLIWFCIKKRLSLLDSCVLIGGHVAHRLGTIYQGLATNSS